jgi:uncharacterized membrane-anchored protein YhcB (DUF1043 family)
VQKQLAFIQNKWPDLTKEVESQSKDIKHHFARTKEIAGKSSAMKCAVK